jgi:molecular chaperone Hsp33
LVQEAVDQHRLTGHQAQRLGEAMIGGLILSSYTKAGERINLNIRGNGEIKQGLVEAFPDGKLRAYVVPQEVMLHPLEHPAGASIEILKEKPLPMGPWGEGLISVLRTKGSEGMPPYVGTVPMATGHLAKDLTFYWYQSEQVPSAVAIVVNVKGNRVLEAGGFLIQAMPGATSMSISMIENQINQVGFLKDRFLESIDPTLVLTDIFEALGCTLLEEQPLVLHCECSREKVARSLGLLPNDDLESLIADQKPAEIRCDFCTKEYHFSIEQLKAMLKK